MRDSKKNTHLPVRRESQFSTRYLAPFGISRAAIRCVGTRDHAVYRVKTSSATYALRIHVEGTDAATIRGEFALLAHLSERLPGRVPVPIDASVVGGRHVSLLSWVPGRVPKRPSPRLARLMGSALAEIHRASEGCEITGGYDWTTQGHFGVDLEAALDELKPHLLEADHGLLRERAALLSQTYASLAHVPAVTLHGDFYPLNVLHQSGRLGVIDFANFGRGPRAYDLAVCLRHAWPAGDSKIVAAYQTIYPLSSRELEALPGLIQARMLHMAIHAAKLLRQSGGTYDPARLLSYAVQSLRNTPMTS